MGKKKENLLEQFHLTEAHKRLQQLFEYSFYGGGGGMAQDDQDQNNQMQGMPQGGDPMGGAQGAMGGGMQDPNIGMSQQDPGMGGGMPQGGNPMGGGMQDPNMGMPPQDPGMGGGMPQGGDPMGGAQGAMGGGMPEDEPVEEDVPMDGEMGGPDMGGDMDTEPMQEDDEVIDVDDLTNAQQTTEYKIDGVNDKLTTLMDVMSKYAEALKLSNDKIDDLKAEIERRNPTEEERLNIRSQSSSPFTENPKDFWSKFKSGPRGRNYDVIYDNDIPANEEEQEYVIREKDIDGANDRGIYDSLDVPQRLKNVLSF